MYISFKFNVKINKYKYFPLVKSENKVIVYLSYYY